MTACNNNLYYGLRGVFYLPRGRRRVPKTHVRHPQTVLSEGLDGAVGMCARNRAPMNHVIIMLLVCNARRTPGVPALLPSATDTSLKGFSTDTVIFFFSILTGFRKKIRVFSFEMMIIFESSDGRPVRILRRSNRFRSRETPARALPMIFDHLTSTLLTGKKKLSTRTERGRTPPCI